MGIYHDAVCEGDRGAREGFTANDSRGAEPSGVIFQRMTSVGDEVAHAGRSTAIERAGIRKV